MKFNIEEELNDQNLHLLSQLREKMEVEFEYYDEIDAQVFSIENRNIISINPNFFSNSAVAHELLHVWFRSLNLHCSNGIYLSAQENYKFGLVFDKRLCDFIGNCMEHYYIFPKFLEMGYLKEEFLSNEGMQCSLDSVKNLRIMKNDVYSPKDINMYIGLLISIYADHLSFDYSQHLELLEKMNGTLFMHVTNFWNAWMTVDIEEEDILKRTDFECFHDFITDMQEWIDTIPFKKESHSLVDYIKTFILGNR